MENNDPWSDGFPIFVLQVIVLAAAYMVDRTASFDAVCALFCMHN